MVTFNRPILLEKILENILSYNWPFDNFIIVDNGSDDTTINVLNKYKNSLSLDILTLHENIGHGAGLAHGMRRLNESGEIPTHIIFLEDDSIPQQPYLDFLLQAAQDSKYSLISSGGYLVRLGKRIKLQPKQNEILSADFGLFDGAIAKFDDLMKIGYPVEDWFMMFDDFEYCYRIKNAGLQIGVLSNPFIEILHEGWGGGNSHSHLWRTYYQSRNFVLFVRKHLTWFNFFDGIILNSKRLIGGLFSKNGFKVTMLRLLGLKAGLFGKTGISLDLKTLREI